MVFLSFLGPEDGFYSILDHFRKTKRVLQFFLILQNPPPSKVTKYIFYNISSCVLMLSASKCFW